MHWTLYCEYICYVPANRDTYCTYFFICVLFVCSCLCHLTLHPYLLLIVYCLYSLFIVYFTQSLEMPLLISLHLCTSYKRTLVREVQRSSTEMVETARTTISEILKQSGCHAKWKPKSQMDKCVWQAFNAI